MDGWREFPVREIEPSDALVACCGLYCGACSSYLKEKCDGCAKNEKATWCKVRACCIEKQIASCAACGEPQDPRECRKFNNVISKLFGLVFRSDRAACIDQVRRIGLSGHASAMAELRMHTLRRR